MKFIEATNGVNWGKFALMRFTEEQWRYRSLLDHGPLLSRRGWTRAHLFVMDLQTGEGAMFAPRPRPLALAAADLTKRKIWVCPLFEPFLEWLYEQDLSDLDALPALVELPDAPSSLWGYRRQGQEPPDDDEGQGGQL